jgi:hypothetical protein
MTNSGIEFHQGLTSSTEYFFVQRYSLACHPEARGISSQNYKNLNHGTKMNRNTERTRVRRNKRCHLHNSRPYNLSFCIPVFHPIKFIFETRH